MLGNKVSDVLFFNSMTTKMHFDITVVFYLDYASPNIFVHKIKMVNDLDSIL